MALIQINQFKGINEIVDPTMLGEEGVIAENCSIRNGILKGAKKPLKKTSIPQLPGIKNIMTYYSNTGSIFAEIVATNKTGIYILNQQTNIWTLASNENNIDICSYVNNYINDQYIMIITGLQSRTKVIRKDVSGNITVRNLKMSGKNSIEDTYNKAPYGNTIILHYDRLWIADFKSVYCSSLTANGGIDIDDFTTPTSPPSEVNQHGAEISMYTEDGTTVCGIVSVFDDILVFKGKSIFKLSGTGPADLQKIELFKGAGSTACKTIVPTPYGCFFVNQDGIYLYDGAGVNKISQKIDNTLKSLSSYDIYYSVAAFYDNKYIVSIQNQGTEAELIEYDCLTGDFIIRTKNYTKSFTEHNGELLFVSEDGYIYSYDKGITSNFIWQSGDLSIPEGAIEIEGVKLHTEGTGRLKVSVITEKKTKEKIVDIVKDGVKYISINNTGRGASIKLEQLSGDISIRKLYVEYDLDED